VTGFNQKDSNYFLFQKILSPRKFKVRYELDPRDSLQGKMEKFIQEAEKQKKLLTNQGGPLGSYLGLFKESLLILNGKVREVL
jgi:hypothetical protein